MATADKKSAEAAGWQYDHSAALGIDFAIRRTADGAEIMTADKVRYSPAETALLQKAGGITPGVHAVKKVFDGRIVAVTP